jgi:serine/threonine-protein kinase
MTSVDSFRVDRPHTSVAPSECEIPASEVPPGIEVIALAGTGGFCEVWKVRSLKEGATFALKRLKPDWRSNAAARKLLGNEARVAAAVKSRNVLSAASTQTANVEVSALFEWLEGESLESRLGARGQIPVETTVWVARQCVQGLLALEQAGFSHGDIKPANIFLASSGDVKLVDLGFARSTGIKPSDASKVLTGTAEYMAPESLSRLDSPPIAKDVYSLGITLFRMLTGELPFVADTTADVLQLQRTARPPQLRRRCPEVPSEFAQVVQQMLAKQPIRRPTCLRDLVRTLIDFELNLFPQRHAA